MPHINFNVILYMKIFENTKKERRRAWIFYGRQPFNLISNINLFYVNKFKILWNFSNLNHKYSLKSHEL